MLVVFNHDGFECDLNRILQWTSRTKGLLQCALSDTQSYSSCIQIDHSCKSPNRHITPSLCRHNINYDKTFADCLYNNHAWLKVVSGIP